MEHRHWVVFAGNASVTQACMRENTGSRAKRIPWCDNSCRAKRPQGLNTPKRRQESTNRWQSELNQGRSVWQFRSLSAAAHAFANLLDRVACDPGGVGRLPCNRLPGDTSGDSQLFTSTEFVPNFSESWRCEACGKIGLHTRIWNQLLVHDKLSSAVESQHTTEMTSQAHQKPNCLMALGWGHCTMPVRKTNWKYQSKHPAEKNPVHHGSRCPHMSTISSLISNPALQRAAGLLLMGKQSPQTGQDDLLKKIEKALLLNQDTETTWNNSRHQAHKT